MLKTTSGIGLLCAVSLFAQSSPVTSAQLFVEVRPEAALAWQGDSTVLVKARLAAGTQARVWADDACRVPATGSYVISASSTVAIEIAAINGAGKPMVCLSSSDGRINASLAALH